MYKVFLIEDDPSISALLSEHMTKWGFNVKAAGDLSDVMPEFLCAKADIAIIDISLPYFNGFHWCTKIREVSTIPILFLSSHTDHMDIVMAMNMGGDDYLTKPFYIDVLLAKVNALLRRAYSYASVEEPLCVGGAVLNPSGCVLEYDGRKTELTKNELKILQTLFEKKNTVVSRESIMRSLWEDESFIDDNTLTVNINRLRAKLEDAGVPNLIVTKKGMGYAVYDS